MKVVEIRNLAFITYKKYAYCNVSTKQKQSRSGGQLTSFRQCYAMPCQIVSNNIEIKTDIFGLYRSTANRLGEQ